MIPFEPHLNSSPRTEFFSEFDPHGEYNGTVFDGIRALAYDGPDYNGLHTKIFAHIGFPEDTSAPVPAVVLVHGGGGHPEDLWIRKWNARGYAAISMDTTGFFPTKPSPHMREGFAEYLERRLVPPFAEEGYTVAPNNSNMQDSLLPIEQQWMYHAVAAVILAHNILRNDPRIDRNKIGICGISWGGTITSIAIGYDPRFAFAIPIYGSGYLGCGLSDLNDYFRRTGVQKWFAEKRFPSVSMPVLWLCWNDDCCFSVNSNSMSYLDTKENNRNTCLSMLHLMYHSHTSGYTPLESYWFADEVCRGAELPQVTAEYSSGQVEYSCSAAVKSVRLFFITEPMTYILREKHGMKRFFMQQEWQIQELDPTKRSATLPPDAVGKYVEFTLENGIVLTTPYLEPPTAG